MLSEPKGLNEECGVFGIWGNPNAASITHLGLHTLQHRGQEGAGIVGLTKDGMRRHYGLGLLSEVFTNTDQLTPLVGRAAFGSRALLDSGRPGLGKYTAIAFSVFR